MQQVRGLGAPTLLVDGGDTFFSTPTKKAPTRPEELQAMRRARSVLNAYNMLGYQAIAVGPADLQLGLGVLKQLATEASCPLVCANLVDPATKKPVFQSHVIVEVDGLKFGIYGVMMALTNKTYSDRVLEGMEVLDAEAVTRELVPRLRKECDIVLALSHLNVEENMRILETNPGIDILLDPLSRNGTKAIWVPENEYVLLKKGTPLLRIDGQGSRVGYVELKRPQDAKKFSQYVPIDGALEPHIARHPEMQRLIDDFEKGRVAPLQLDSKPGSIRLSTDYLGEEACGSCHEEQLAFWKKTRHAVAYSSLEAGHTQEQFECIGCHTLAYGAAFAVPSKIGTNKNVQCESCHGVNAAHADNPRAARMSAVNEETCWGCHNPQLLDHPFDITSVKDSVSCPKIQVK